MVEKQRTRKESLIAALKWGALFLTVLGGMAYWMLSTLRHSAVSASQVQATGALIDLFTLVIPASTAFFMYMVYGMQRNESTYKEVEDRERAQARRLLAKYPDLKDEK